MQFKKAINVLKELKMKQLKSALTNKESVLTTKKYFISLPSEEAHEKSHPIGAIAGIAQKMHPAISKRIESLVREGTTDGHTIQTILKEYVNTTMSDTPLPPPCKTDRVFYPTVTDINNHVTKVKSALQLSKLDQQNLHLKVQEWENQIQMLITIFVHLEAQMMVENHNHCYGYTKRSGKETFSSTMGIP